MIADKMYVAGPLHLFLCLLAPLCLQWHSEARHW
jgi:hypothetical protein